MRPWHNNVDKQRDHQNAKHIESHISDKWSRRFVWTTIIQGAIVAILTAMLANLSRILSAFDSISL
jgi:hypothetical protein